MLKAFIRPALILIPLTLGVCIPAAAEYSWLIRWAIIYMLFMVYLQINLRDLRISRMHWFILIVNFLMGLIPWLLIRLLFPGNRDLAQAAFFVGITPTATAAPVVMSFLHGRMGVVTTGFVLTNITIAASMPLLLPLVTGRFDISFLGRVFWNILLLTAVPFSLAYVMKKLIPGAKAWAGRHKTLSFLTWSLVLFLLGAVARKYFRDNPNASVVQALEIAALSLVLCVLNFLIGGIVSPKMKRREGSQMLGQKNTSFTMYLALMFASPATALGPIFYVLWHNSWNAWQMFRYTKRNIRKQSAIINFRKER